MNGNTGWVNLGVARIRKTGATTVRTECRRYIATLCIGREIENISVSTRAKHDDVGGPGFDFAGN